MGPRILVFQHHPASPAGLVGERMAARAARVTTLDAQAGVDLPDDAADHDGLLILGGAMNAYDDDALPPLPRPARPRPHLRRRRQARPRHLPRRPAAGPRLGGAGPSRRRPGIRRRPAHPHARSRRRPPARRRPGPGAGDAVARGHLRPARGRHPAPHRHRLPQPGLPRRRGGLGLPVPLRGRPPRHGRRGRSTAATPTATRTSPPGWPSRRRRMARPRRRSGGRWRIGGWIEVTARSVA